MKLFPFLKSVEVRHASFLPLQALLSGCLSHRLAFFVEIQAWRSVPRWKLCTPHGLKIMIPKHLRKPDLFPGIVVRALVLQISLLEQL